MNHEEKLFEKAQGAPRGGWAEEEEEGEGERTSYFLVYIQAGVGVKLVTFQTFAFCWTLWRLVTTRDEA